MEDSIESILSNLIDEVDDAEDIDELISRYAYLLRSLKEGV